MMSPTPSTIQLSQVHAGTAPAWQIELFGHNNSCSHGTANSENLISGRGPRTLIISYFTAALNSCYSLINRMHEPWMYFVSFPWENWVFTTILAEMLIMTITTNWWEIENICNKKTPTVGQKDVSQSEQIQNVFAEVDALGGFFPPHNKHWKKLVQNLIIWGEFDLNVCKSELVSHLGVLIVTQPGNYLE